MQKKKFLIGIAVFVWVIFLLDLCAQIYFMYWRFWWYDILMHFLGGFWLALVGYYIFYLSDFKEKIKTWKPGFQVGFFEKYSFLVVSLVFVLTVGLLWEGFELALKVFPKSNYIFDTILDLIMDMLGWLMAYLFVLKRFNLSKIVKKPENIC